MKKIIGFFVHCIKPVILFCIISGLFILSEIVNIRSIQNICFILLLLGFLVLLVSAVFRFAVKGWLPGVVSLAVFITASFCFILYSWSAFWKIQSEPDRFADDLKIPDKMELEYPRNENIPPDPPGYHDREGFQLYSSFQPGLYKYSAGLDFHGKGTIYLKAFEITKNTPLSASRLKERSSIQVMNTADSIRIFKSALHFTIYEGDWGKPYAARFEVWFIPEGNGAEKKIFEKNYIIEGWQF